ncbi:hypothetical protein D5F01_LYC21658 [Larimichthys crocea]|uniref:Uncharacterized protein n=1 Tax=Larimichthys crocea TaxID=215358 RepID=A0A6G0HQ28_LARCR|nr:hypothetical protein D5F01_LYC21658 [Larimichthys crocea]
MSCCATGCRNRYANAEGLHFYRIPSAVTPFDAERRRLWLEAINREDWTDEFSSYDAIRNARICSAHFVSGKSSLDPESPDFVPTLFWQSERKKTPKKRDRKKKKVTAAVEPTTDSQQQPDSQMWLFTNAHSVPEDLLPSLQQYGIKVEQIEDYPQIKEEQVDQCISPDVEADTSNSAEVRLPKSEPTSDCELFPSYASVTVTLNEDDEDGESDGSSPPPHQSHSVEVFVELEQPPRDEKSCRFCGKRFKRDSFLIRHVERSHKGQKAFKCLKCNKEFDQRNHLILHVRIHTGEKPFSCDFCDKTFSQNSSRIVHMRVHTGEKPYYCAKCGKSFASSSHFKFCKMKKEFESAPEKVNTDENPKEEEKTFKCSECSKMFRLKQQLILHQRVHTGEKPFRCNLCGKTFTQSSSRMVHMRVHTGEKPYLCKNCGKRFASRKHLKLCTVTKKSKTKSFHCATCGRFFHTEIDLNVHMQVHESWKRHLSEKLQEQE